MSDDILLRNLASLRKRLGQLGWLNYNTYPADGYSTLLWGFSLHPNDYKTAAQYGGIKVWHSEPDCDLKTIQAMDHQIECMRMAEQQ